MENNGNREIREIRGRAELPSYFPRVPRISRFKKLLGKDLGFPRRLDCVVIEMLQQIRQEEGKEPFDTAHPLSIARQSATDRNATCGLETAGVVFFEMSVREIKEAVKHLSLEERAEVAACLHSWNEDEWDEQMRRDLAAGRLNRILAQVDADIAENRVREMP
jgi:hypothetical protein